MHEFSFPVTAMHHSMDIEEHPELIYGEEFCFPAIATYYPTFYNPTGINVPPELYEHKTVLGFNDQGLHYTGQQAGGISSMYYVVPDYGITHPPYGHGPRPFHPCAIADGRFAGAQEHRAGTVEHTYYQQVHPFHYAAVPSAASRTPASTAQPIACTNGLFPHGGLGQIVAAASERSSVWSPSVQSASVSSTKFRDRTVVPERQLRGPAPCKRQIAGRAIVPAKLPRALRASQLSQQAAVPSVRSSLQANISYNNQVSNVGSDLWKSAEKSQPCAETRTFANQRLSFLSQQNICKEKKPIGSIPSEIIVKSYTSRLRIGNPEGKIILRTDQYNRDDFQVVYPNARFFVMKSFDEADVHKSIKYGVWSTSSIGHKKLGDAFREAQAIAASSSTSCPVFLFFSVNGSSRFCGVAEMVGPVDWKKDMDFWCKDKWIGSFPVRWHIIKDVYNSALRSILLQNNEDNPVTKSRDAQEIYYTPGTTMLKIFKYDAANESLLDKFMMYEVEEARSSQRKRFKLRRATPQFKLRQAAPQCMPASMHAHHSCNTLLPTSPQPMPASVHAHHACSTLLTKSRQYTPASAHARHTYKTLLPKSDTVLMDTIIRETNDLTGQLEHLNLDRHQGSWQEFENLACKASTQKESYCYGEQAHENIVKTMAYQAYQPLTSSVKAPDGEQQYWKNETVPGRRPHAETASPVSSKAPQEHPNEDKNALAHSASGAPHLICETQKITGKPCSLAVNSQSSEACSKLQARFVAIGSILVPIAMPK